MDWYYAVNRQQLGPVSDEDFQKLIQAGTITPDTLVWHDGMPNWVPLNKSGAAVSPAPPEAPQPQPASGSPRLAVKRAPAAPAAQSTAVGPAGQAGMGMCAECGRHFPVDQMIQYERSTICAECKPRFFQRLQEGAPPSRSQGGVGSTPNRDLMAQAREALQGRWWLAVGVLFVSNVVGQGLAQFIPFGLGTIAYLIILGPLTLGLAIFFLNLSLKNESRFAMLFHGFSQFGSSFAAMFFVTLFILLWSLLLVIPGILAAFSYSMTFYILADDRQIGGMDAIRRSKEMMRGMRWKFFCLNFRFMGWILLCIVPYVAMGVVMGMIGAAAHGRVEDSLGVGMGLGFMAMFLVAGLVSGVGYLFVNAYMQTSIARFYDDVRGRVAD